MAHPFIDTDVIIRFLTGDDPVKQGRAARLFEQIEQQTLDVIAPYTVIADAVYVLSSPRLYNISRQAVAALLIPLVRLPGFHVENRPAVIAALDLYGNAPFKLDFGDALILAEMQLSGATIVYSFDHDLAKLPGITRQDP